MAILGMRVRQWLPEWDEVPVDPEKFQSRPPKEFYLASMPAWQLRALSDVHARDANPGLARADDTSVQRSLEQDRTTEIRRYVKVGYPLSSIGARVMDASERRSLRKPGWLPTAIIANIVPAGAERSGKVLDSRDAMSIEGGDSGQVEVRLPASWSASAWGPKGAHPLEIIDGQHRLSAFDLDVSDDFELPVVLFEGLDFSWQAYLFWTVNIKPKRINASLAFDLYPLLREQDWLEAGESLNVYRETRAQELVEILWGDARSVWYDRINMLGETGIKATRPVTQSAFVRSLTTSMVRSFRGHKGLGGLFGGAADNTGFNWPRGQQGAFLVAGWNALASAILSNQQSDWVLALRSSPGGEPPMLPPTSPRSDPAFAGAGSLLASDQGVRAFHMVLNDLAYLGQEELALSDWRAVEDLDVPPDVQFDTACDELQGNAIGDFLRRLGVELALFDWRNSRAHGLSDSERESKMALRGSGGYNVLRGRILAQLAKSSDEQVSTLAAKASEIHGA